MADSDNLVSLLRTLKISESKFIADSKYDNAVDRIVAIIEKYKDHKNLEYEFRLGYIEDNNSFSPQIPDEFYEKIMKKLKTNTKWKSVCNLEIMDYEINGLRHSVVKNITDGTTNTVTVKKTSLVRMNFRYHDTPFDIRFSISKEEPISTGEKLNPENSTYTRDKKRTSFIHKFWRYDITKIEVETNGIKELSNEVELELNIPNDPKNDLRYLVTSSLLKLGDLSNICEKHQGTEHLEFISLFEKK
jgi:hypothetical protein